MSALHQCAVTALRAAGRYHDTGANRAHASKEIERLLKCHRLVLVFPIWWYGMPAMLKGYIDRIWLPDVVFELAGGRTKPMLNNVERFAVATTDGSPWWLNKLIFDPNHSTLMRGIRQLFPRVPRALWLAQYGMDAADAAPREKFRCKVERKLRAL